MSVDDTLEWPALGNARPGARFVLGVESPGAISPLRGALPEHFRYSIGTVGALAGTPREPYLITAGHVVSGFDDAGFPEVGTAMLIGFLGNQVRPWQPGPPLAVKPSRARRSDGTLIDAVAIPVPPDLLPDPLVEMVVDDALDLTRFVGRSAFMLVQRGGRPLNLDGHVEHVIDPGLDESGIQRPQRIAFRFTGQTSVLGDSGAPVLTIDHNGSLHLLGLHYFEDDPSPSIRTLSVATAAAAVRDHIKLSIF